MYFDKQKGIKVLVTHGEIGPSHDPYGTCSVQITRGDKSAMFYSDGLGQFRFFLTEAGDITRSIEWVDCLRRPKSVCNETKVNILARRHVGVRFDEAEEFFNRNWRPDPIRGYI